MAKRNRAWFMWIVGKQPDFILEIVSNTPGGEDTEKLTEYAKIGVTYYVIHDPKNYLGNGKLRGFELREGEYAPIDPRWLPGLGLGLVFRRGVYEDFEDEWLRWCDEEGRVLPTGREGKTEAEQRVSEERKLRIAAEQRASEEQKLRAAAEQRASEEQKLRTAVEQRSSEAKQRAERLAAQLRELGVDVSK